MAVVGGLITAALSAGSQLANYFINERNIERQNAYNSPAAQVSRLRAAGINPYAAVGQIAGNNQGITNRAEFDFGKSSQAGFDVYNDLTRTSIQQDQNELYLQKLEEEVRKLRNNNRLFEDSYNYRLESLNYASQKAFFDMLYASGKLDRQSYDNTVAYINSEFSKYKSGLDSEIFGKFNTLITGADGRDNFVPVNYMANDLFFDYNIKQMTQNLMAETYDYKKEYEKFKTLKTEQDYKKASVDYLRNWVAYRYEQTMNMPWNTQDPWLHVLAPVIDFVTKKLTGESWADFWESLPDRFDEQ